MMSPGAAVRSGVWSAAQVLYLFAPLLCASAIAAVGMRFDVLKRLKRPIDGGATWHGKRWFGDNKTWRGVALAIIGCVVGAVVQCWWIGDLARGLALLDYAHTNPWLFGVAMALGAMVGELPNSFVKRRLGIAPGATARGALRVLFYVWDQVDMFTTVWATLAFWFTPTWRVVVATFVLALLLHPVVALLGYLLRVRKTVR